MNALWAALSSRLIGNSAITHLLAEPSGVYDTLAPEEAKYPLIIFQHQAGTIETIDPQTRNDIYISVKAISMDGFRGSESIDEAVNSALDNLPLSITGHSNFWLRRTADVRYLEDGPDARIYYHVGGVYRVRLSHA